MRLHLQRDEPTLGAMTGTLTIDGTAWSCFTIERSPMDLLFQPVSAGTYELNMRESPHFGYRVPGLRDVPGRTDIEIHVANRADDVKGCIGVGQRLGVDAVYQSRPALDLLIRLLEAAEAAAERSFLTIEDARP